MAQRKREAVISRATRMRANTITLVKSIAKLYSALRDADRQMRIAATFQDGGSSILNMFDERAIRSCSVIAWRSAALWRPYRFGLARRGG